MTDRTTASTSQAELAGNDTREDPALIWPEEDRLDALYDLQILDTPPDPAFERIISVTRRLFNVPIVLVSFVDEHRQWFKARCGLEVQETERSVSFCAHAIRKRDRMLVVLDTLDDPRFLDNPVVTGPPHVRFYAGAVVTAPNGAPLGTLCIIDMKPRESFVGEDRTTLADLAALVSDELKLREAGLRLQSQLDEAELTNSRLTEMLDRQDREMRLAAQAQRTILPPEGHRAPGLKTGTMLRPSYIMSGDAYGFGALSEECGYFWLADVAGHGLAAALLATTLSLVLTDELLFESTSGVGRPPAEVLQRLHRQLALWRDEQSYFTMVYGARRAGENGVRIAVAGHPPPIVMAPREPPRALAAGGLPVGMFEKTRFEDQWIPLEPGARVLVYSDGVTDAMDEEMETFGYDRMIAWLEDTRKLEPGRAVAELQTILEDWSGPASSDDATALLFDLV